ncbi:MAG: carboxypeptidase-like regulatory domain-containing protein [Saprospiraceae bacterium]|nr:carboxypeptidase-like regulatory domain-containing protein [Saprospiraceae bacterium]
MRFLLSFVLLCLTPLLMAQRALEYSIFDAETKEPIEGASILVKDTSGSKYFFSNRYGRVRLDMQGKGRIIFSHLNYESQSTSIETLPADATERVFLIKKEHALNEVVVSAGKVDFFALLEQLIQGIRSKRNRPEERMFQYELTTWYDSVLVEKSDGVVLGSISLAAGVEQLDFVTGRYCLLESHPFFNLSFLQTLKLNSLFRKNTDAPIRTPLSFKKIDRSNTVIQSLSCAYCSEKQRLLLLSPTDTALASARVLLDVETLDIDQVSVLAPDCKALFPIDKKHRLSNLNLEASYTVRDQAVQFVQMQYSLGYMNQIRQQDSVRVQLVLKPVYGKPPMKTFHAGYYRFVDDYERLLTYPLNIPFLEDLYHREDAELLRAQYARMTKNDALYDNQYVLGILQSIIKCPVQLWNNSFCICQIHNLDEQAQQQDPQAMAIYDQFFDFNWVFLRKSEPEGPLLESAPTFINLNASVFYGSEYAHAVLFYNLVFDYAELVRRQTFQKLSVGKPSDAEISRVLEKAYQQTRSEIRGWAFRSKYGSKPSELIALNEMIRQALGKDNFNEYYSLLAQHRIEDPRLLYPDVLSLIGEYGKAIEYYTELLSDTKFTKAERLNIVHNRAQCYAKQKDFKALCADIRYLQANHFPQLDTALLDFCKE